LNTTSNYGLKEPLQTEFYNVDDFNYNSEIIDTEMHRLSTEKQDKLSTPQMDAVDSGITSAKVSKLDALPTSTQLDASLSTKANKTDITNISITGTTNNTGSNILAGTLFYLNGALCKTLVDVANGATFTDGTNYSTWTLKNTQDMINKFYVELPTNYYNMDNDYDFSEAKARQVLSDFISIAGTESRTGFIRVFNGWAYSGQYYITSQSYYHIILSSYDGNSPQYKLSKKEDMVYVKKLLYS